LDSFEICFISPSGRGRLASLLAVEATVWRRSVTAVREGGSKILFGFLFWLGEGSAPLGVEATVWRRSATAVKEEVTKFCLVSSSGWARVASPLGSRRLFGGARLLQSKKR
jgi:hypothetical protein